MKKHIILLILICIGIPNINAQWSKGKGNGYYKLAAWYLKYNKHFGENNQLDPNRTRTQFNTNIYAEYGISNTIDVIAYVPFFSRIAQNNEISGTNNNTLSKGEAFNSFGDIDLGINYQYYKKDNWAASVKLLLGIPTGSSTGGSDGSFQTGDGEFNQYLETALGYGGSIKEIPIYAKISAGFNNRTNGFSDELRAGFEIGANFFKKKFWLISRINTVNSLNNGTLSAVTSNGSIFANNIEYATYGFEGAYYFTKKIGASLSFNSAFSGKIIAASPSYSAGIFMDIK